MEESWDANWWIKKQASFSDSHIVPITRSTQYVVLFHHHYLRRLNAKIWDSEWRAVAGKIDLERVSFSSTKGFILSSV